MSGHLIDTYPAADRFSSAAGGYLSMGFGTSRGLGASPTITTDYGSPPLVAGSVATSHEATQAPVCLRTKTYSFPLL